MNWLQKIATKRGIHQWANDLHKTLEFQIPGHWKPHSWEMDIGHASFFGEDILIKPNALFFVRVAMHRPEFRMIYNEEQQRDVWQRSVREFDSVRGAPELDFECIVLASGLDKWPTFGDVIGKREMLNTPMEVMEFIKECIESYDPPGSGPDNHEPDLPPAPASGAGIFDQNQVLQGV